MAGAYVYKFLTAKSGKGTLDTPSLALNIIRKKIYSLIYFDNAATTKPCDEAVKAAANALTAAFGNPSSRHRVGMDAEILLRQARDRLAMSLGCAEDEIFFTSGATESNNTAILSACENKIKRLPRVVTTTVEHPSVKACFDKLEKLGAEVVRVAPDENGDITDKMIFDAVNDRTCLVSCMLVNNETGYVLPTAKAFAMIKRKYPDCITHCDAVQGFMKLPFKAKTLFADLISVSGHKIHGAKGVGVLFIKKGTKIAPFMLGGGQEKGFRSGTENLPAIAAMGEAVKLLTPTIDSRLQYVTELREYLVEKLSEIDGIEINSKPSALPYVTSIAMPNFKSETLLNYLSDRGICVSSGSACSKGKKSTVLQEFRISAEKTDSTLRVSFCAENTKAEIDELCKTLKRASGELCTIKRK